MKKKKVLIGQNVAFKLKSNEIIACVWKCMPRWISIVVFIKKKKEEKFKWKKHLIFLNKCKEII